MSATRKPLRRNDTPLAGIEYSGIGGYSNECLAGILRLLQFEDQITEVRILSCERRHCLLLRINKGDLVAIKSGFGSGYVGTGSRTFSFALSVLDAHGAEFEEYAVDQTFLDRVDASALTNADLKWLDGARLVRPIQWHDYVFEEEAIWKDRPMLWERFPPIIPFGIIDSRIIDLANIFLGSAGRENSHGLSKIGGYRPQTHQERRT